MNDREITPCEACDPFCTCGAKNVKVLRQIDVQVGETGRAVQKEDSKIGLVLDVETTGLNVADDSIIELALRRFRFGSSGQIVEIGQAWSWREDPGVALSEDVIRVTGIQDSDLAGHTIDDRAACKIIGSADLVIAHNAAFDRPFIERRLPAVQGMPWSCSCAEVDWAAAGFDGRSLGWLCAQAGWFYDAHRAQNDVDALLTLLGHAGPDGSPLLRELHEKSLSDSWMIEAIGAPFETKDLLRLRGYRWDASVRVWRREVFDSEFIEEQSWLAREIYGQGRGATAMEPLITRRTATTRYS